MNAPEPQRRPFQFSLRKLMLWTAVWALYLGVVARFWLPAVMVLTIYLMALLAIHAKWGLGRGLLRGTLFTGFVCGVMPIIVGLVRGESVVAILACMPLLCLLGFLLGFYGFLYIHYVAHVVDWLDNLMRTKTPQDEQA